MDLGRVPDQYTIMARVLPALLVALPVGLASLAWFPEGISGWRMLWGLAVWCGASVLLGQLGRDAGRRKQAYLFQLWGGPPTTKRLRHSGGGNRVTLDRIHKRLAKLLRTKLPSPDEETADPRAADEVYEACIDYLKSHTRDRKKFHLVFDENCSYGFRRNLWGLKPVGLAVAVGALAATAVLPLIRQSTLTVATLQPEVIPGAMILAILLAWIFVVRPRWVEVPANAYADRLVEATENLMATQADPAPKRG